MSLAMALVVTGFATAGCMGPTYGTDKPAGQQLVDDITNVVALDSTRHDPIDYKPRPELVKPANTTVLPPPQEKVAVANQPNWPESPEDRRAKIRAAADAGDRKTALALAETMDQYPRARSEENTGIADPKQRSAEFQRRIAEQKQGSDTSRKYLSEPPLGYRQPAAGAPVGEQGVDEEVKERRIKAGGKSTIGESLGKLWPF
ncbi:hypothetical protein [Consotaella salsifontis]|uniref:hypothetical protein n=1 Tax=Consotaella salsifontis TaxID=1365950 RepID=UPI001FD90E0C|nr:hypothetical protein [Consotaella salsifontis]